MRAAGLLALLIVAAQACQPDTRGDNVHFSNEDHVSFEVPDSFRLTRDRDTWVLVGEKERAGVAIALRSVERAGWTEDRSPDMLRAPVETVLRAFPGASLKGPTDIQTAAYPGFAFDVTYQPRSKRGERYRRRHAVLVSSGRVFHVLETWPATRAEIGKNDFEQVLVSIREEG